MPTGGTVWLNALLLNSLTIVLAGIGFVAALEGWRRWSESRRIRKHFEH
jgi:hypothetical protein